MPQPPNRSNEGALAWCAAMNIPGGETGEFWSTAVYAVAVVVLCVLMLGLSAMLGGKSGARARNEPFESGVVSASPERLRLSAKFYLVAMFFVIFDVEALYLYAWSISVRESGWMGFIEGTVFVGILTATLIYLARIGALDWAPESRKRGAAARDAQQAPGATGAATSVAATARAATPNTVAS